MLPIKALPNTNQRKLARLLLGSSSRKTFNKIDPAKKATINAINKTRAGSKITDKNQPKNNEKISVARPVLLKRRH